MIQYLGILFFLLFFFSQNFIAAMKPTISKSFTIRIFIHQDSDSYLLIFIGFKLLHNGYATR